MSIKIFTDACSNLFKDILKKKNLDIIVLPMSLQIQDKTYLCYEDNIDIEKLSLELFTILESGKKVKTSLTSPGVFYNKVIEEVDKGNKVIFISVASGISGNFQSASLMAEQINNEKGKQVVKVIDSKTASFGEGMIAIYAYQKAQDNLSFDETIKDVENYVNRVRSEFTVDNIKYLATSGRVSSLVATLANILSIKPILYGSDNAKIEIFTKVHGKGNAIKTLAKQVEDYINDKSSTVYIAHCNAKEDALRLENLLKEKGISNIEIYIYDLITGAHVGKGTLAVFYEGENRNLEKHNIVKTIINKIK